MSAQSNQRKPEPTTSSPGWFGRVEDWIASNYDIVIPVLVGVVVFGFTITRHALPSMVHDAYAYTMAAQRLVRDGYLAFAGGDLPGTVVPPDARVTPGYILFLAAFYGLFGRSGDPIAAVQTVQPIIAGVQFILAVMTVGFVALCGRELGGKQLGLVTGLLASVHVPFAWASMVALSESLAGPLLSAQLLWMLKLIRKDGRRTPLSLLGFGAFSAVVVMVRPSMAAWALIPLLYAFVSRVESWKRFALLSAMAGLGFVLVFAPWWIRNANVLGMFVPLRTDLVRSTSGELVSIASDPPPAATLARKIQLGFLVSTTPWSAPDDVLWENAFHYDQMRVDFGRFPTNTHDRLVPIIKLMRWYKIFLLGAAAVGLFFIRRSPRLLVVAAMPIHTIAVHVSTQVNPRYAFLGSPAIIVIAGAGVYGLWMMARRRLATS